MTRTTRTRAAGLAIAAALAAASALAQQPQATAKTPLGNGPGVYDYAFEFNGQKGSLRAFKPTVNPAQAGNAVLVMTVDSGAPRTFFAWLGALSSGQSASARGAIAISPLETAPAKGTSQNATVVSFENAHLSRLHFPLLGAATSGSLELLTAEVVTNTFRTGPGKPAPTRVPGPTKVTWLANGYRLTLGDLDCRGVDAIAGFELTPNRPLTLSLQTRGATTAAFVKAASPTPSKSAVEKPVTRAPPLEGKLEFLDTGGHVIGTLALHGVRIALPTVPSPAASAPTKLVETAVDITATSVGLSFAPTLGR